ncbi:flavin monoamine oxidase family protein [Congregibacter litoralis]|uniref:Tryptophan 2-monooxygenase n=1 Tax=Congregibacter litoralis KT71 TaxID=314285 RepID=A4A6I1_9GAMM|nr:FAD-dependent oxidoreductase [Congregibacter litoralis]EAQ98628.2 Monoamine oxidase [Congregibacter litoralis KT71]
MKHRPEGNGFSRRQLLSLMGKAGGSIAVWHSAQALGLMGAPAKPTRPQGRMLTPLVPKGGPRPKVAVLGAGIGGLSAAFELEQAGYDVTLLEASHRIGGRNFTVRAGTVIDELGNRQVCNFDDDPDLYFNAGPARLPAMHLRIMNYCREFAIELEPFINSNYNAWVVDEAMHDGQRIRQRDVIADARGFIAELAAKGVSNRSLDTPVSDTDLDKLNAYVRGFGDLNADSMRYEGSVRAGLLTDGMLDPIKVKPFGSVKELVESQFVQGGMLFAENEYQAPTMMQPRGGMDRIVDAFVTRLRKPPVTRARVVEIVNGDNGVTVHYEQDDRIKTLQTDYCLNSIPGQLMAGIKHNFSGHYRQLLGEIKRGMLSKVGFQMSRRFWEEEGIYGGISWTDRSTLQVWYPSHGSHRPKGVVLGAYIFSQDDNAAFGRLSHEERLEYATVSGEALHPGQYREHIESGVSVVWHRMNHLLGCGSGIGDIENVFDLEADKIRAELLAGEGRHFMLGDQMSKHPGWQEGALAVTERVLQNVHRRESARQLSATS